MSKIEKAEAEVKAEPESAIARAVERIGGQQQMADLLGVTQGRVSQWVNGRETIPHRHFPKIEAATRVTAHELLDEQLANARLRATA